VVLVLSLLGAGFFAAWLRFRPYLGNAGSYTDGERVFESAGERLRFAVWDEPLPLPPSVNGREAESRPAVSPDGRFLVFASGRLGLNADLYLAELEGGEPARARPLAAVNTDADELAPAFASDALYFASNRPGGAGRLDLWRVPFRDGSFGAAEPLGPTVNTAADETDPAPVPGSRAVAFASNRVRERSGEDFDLWLATPDGAGFQVRPLDALNSPAQEREPAFTADARTILFASDRGGDFDLHRSVLERGVWLQPTALLGVNSRDAERGPCPSADGFTLLFSVETAADASDLWRARSLELFRVPGRPIGWLDLSILALLLLVALLAWLARRWQQLEILYKCVLISLIIHLLLLWWFRRVQVEPKEVEMARRPGLFQVRLASARPPSGTRERQGRLGGARGGAREEAPARAAAGTPAEGAPRAVALALVRPERSADAAPARGEGKEAPAERPPAEVRTRPAPAEAGRLQGEAPRLELVAAGGDAPAREAAAPGDPARTSPGTGKETGSRLAPSAPSAARPARGLETPGAGARSVVAPSAGPGASAPVAVIGPREEPPRGLLEAPGLALDPGAPSRPDGGAPAAPDRMSGGAAASAREQAAEPDFAAGAAWRLPAGPGASGPGREKTEVSSAREVSRVPVARLPFDDPSPEVGTEPVGELTLAPARGAPAPAAPDEAPARQGGLVASVRESGGAPVPGPRDVPEAPARPASEPFPARRAPDPIAREVRSPAVPGLPSEGPAPSAAAADGAALTMTPAVTPGPVAVEGEPGPRRWSAPEASLPLAPVAREVAGVETRPVSSEPGRSLDHTPYRSRFGAEKAIALREHGGSVQTEKAVAAGLAYLAKRQKRPGNWGSRDREHDKYLQACVGKTGLALLAFLGAGHTPDSGTEHYGVARKAVDFLVSIQDEETGHFGWSESYSHGIATYALAECYALTKDPRLKEPIERGVVQIVRHQNRTRDQKKAGGWSYFYPDGRTFDSWPRVSITAWQVMALESARLSGLEVADGVFEAARAYLWNSVDRRRGWFRYSQDPSRLNSGYPTLPGSTPAGLFALSLLGEDLSDPRLAPALAFTLDRAPREYRRASEEDFVTDAAGNDYFWYYGTLALFRRGGAPWQQWNERMKETLVGAQEADGSWRPISHYAEIAGDDQRERSYSTAINVLTLEVYYRYFTPLLKVR